MFYLVLVLCIVMVGAFGYIMFSSIGDESEESREAGITKTAK